jgi:hypothetical protein
MSNDSVPNVVHIIKLDKSPIRNWEMINYMSILHKIDPVVLFIHGVLKPFGPYWELLLKYYPNRITFNMIRGPIGIFGNFPSEKDFAHKSDIIRMNILRNRGGIYLDNDILIIRPLKEFYRYSITLAYQTEKEICNAMIMTNKNNIFLAAWYESYRTAEFAKCWDCHSVQIPSKMIQSNVSLTVRIYCLFIDIHLNFMLLL